MRLWRLSREPYLARVLEGQGAKRYGGRWNSRGVAVVYTSESLELALLEALVHLDLDLIPGDYFWLCLEVDDALVGGPPRRLPKGWDLPPPYQAPVQRIGDRWIEGGETVALRVPSSVLPERHNVLLNPAHPDLRRVKEVERRRLEWPARLLDALRQRRTPGR